MDFKNKKSILASAIILGAILFFIAFKIGQKNALEVELQAIDEQISETSVRVNPSEHLKLLAKRKSIQNLLNKL